jgi:hypothetical protein
VKGLQVPADEHHESLFHVSSKVSTPQLDDQGRIDAEPHTTVRLGFGGRVAGSSSHKCN